MFKIIILELIHLLMKNLIKYFLVMFIASFN